MRITHECGFFFISDYEGAYKRMRNVEFKAMDKIEAYNAIWNNDIVIWNVDTGDVNQAEDIDKALQGKLEDYIILQRVSKNIMLKSLEKVLDSTK
jgi:hypothetical protein